MKHPAIIIGAALSALLFGSAGSAQVMMAPGASRFDPPPPAPPPPPKITAPVVPQMDAPVSHNYAPEPRPSFSDKITGCLDQGAASGLGPNDRAAYSRTCANR
jgi:hypothetical protein